MRLAEGKLCKASVKKQPFIDFLVTPHLDISPWPMAIHSVPTYSVQIIEVRKSFFESDGPAACSARARLDDGCLFDNDCVQDKTTISWA